jgi:hypothetical protein
VELAQKRVRQYVRVPIVQPVVLRNVIILAMEHVEIIARADVLADVPAGVVQQTVPEVAEDWHI